MRPIDKLKNQVLLFASSADVQVDSYPEGVCVGDESALDFDEALRSARTELAPNQIQAVERLDEYILSVSGADFEDLWLDQTKLRFDERWETIRSLAKEMLVEMGWQYETPVKNVATYVFADSVVENK